MKEQLLFVRETSEIYQLFQTTLIAAADVKQRCFLEPVSLYCVATSPSLGLLDMATDYCWMLILFYTINSVKRRVHCIAVPATSMSQFLESCGA